MPPGPESDALALRLAMAGVASHVLTLDPAGLPAGVGAAAAEAALAAALSTGTGTAIFRLSPFRYALTLAPEEAAALPARLPWPGATVAAIPAGPPPDAAGTRLAAGVAQARLIAGPQAMLLLEAGLALAAASPPAAPPPDAGALRAALRDVLAEAAPGPDLPAGEAGRILAELGNQRMMLNGLRAAIREIDRSLALGPRLAAPRPLLDRLERLAALIEADGPRPAAAVSPAAAAR